MNNPFGGKETEFFYKLTPDVVLNAVEKCGLTLTGRVLQLNSMENRVYEIEIEAPEAKEKADTFVIAKFYRPGRWTKEQILEEHEFLFDLEKQEIPVVVPIKVEEESLFYEDDIKIYFSLFKKCGGRNIAEIEDSDIEIVGRLIARMHNVGAVKEYNQRITINASSYGSKHLEYLENANLIDLNLKSNYLNIANLIVEKAKKVLNSKSNIRIHGDAHMGNLLKGRDGFFWVDFDDSLMGPPVQDIWLLIPGRDDYSIKQRDALITGYLQFRDFDFQSLNLIEILRALRMIHFSSWIGKRFEDPAFQKVFSEYGTYSYWLSELNSLEEIARLIDV